MNELPGDLLYTNDHEWLRREDDGTVTIGITEHAQDLLGDLVFVETPEVGSSYAVGDDCAVVESVKAASDVYSPLSGDIVEANQGLADTPESINSDPYGEGWIFKMKLADEGELDSLMDATAYAAQIAAED